MARFLVVLPEVLSYIHYCIATHVRRIIAFRLLILDIDHPECSLAVTAPPAGVVRVFCWVREVQPLDQWKDCRPHSKETGQK